MSDCTWSPDGRWLAAVRVGRIVLIDATIKAVRLKSFRVSPRGPVHWSPDSRYLLFAQSQLSCIAYIYAESLAAIDVETGRKIPIKSAHCAITWPVIGWLDSAIAQ